MAGHVFVVRADIRKLACDAWLMPCSRTAQPSGPWFLDDHSGPRGGAPFVEGGPRTQSLPGVAAGRPRPWLTRVGGARRPVRWYVAGAVEFLEAAARQLIEDQAEPLFRRARHLLALAVVGTGRGGAAGRAGEVVRELLPTLEAFAARRHGGKEFDIVLVCWDAPAYAAAQAERQNRQFQPANLSTELRAAVEPLAEHARHGRLALFLGAGVSAAAGLPTWAALLDRLAERAGLTADERRALADLRSAQDQATVVEHRFKEQGADLGEAVRAELGGHRHQALAHVLLAALPVREAVTTNYDHLFDDAWSLADPDGLTVLPGQIRADTRQWLMKMHGSLSEPSNIVLTRASYTRYDDRLPGLTGLVQAVLVTRHVLFVGFSLTDDNFHRIVDAVRRLAGAGGRRDRFGTTLSLGREGLAEVLWDRDLHRIRMDDRPMDKHFPTAEAARRLEAFLDYLLFKTRDTAHLLVGSRFNANLTPGEKVLRDALNDFVAAVTGPNAAEVRTTVAWPQVERLLRALGFDPLGGAVDRRRAPGRPWRQHSDVAGGRTRGAGQAPSRVPAPATSECCRHADSPVVWEKVSAMHILCRGLMPLKFQGLALLIVATVAGVGAGQESAAPKATTHMVAMGDGVKLATDVYLPGDGTGKYPVIVARTPYNKSAGGPGLAANSIRRGYAFVIQDMRGRFKSEGRPAIIFGNDGLGDHEDGPDTLKWVAQQPWCDGTIGTWGGSALGIAQNMAAPGAPDALKAQHVAVAFSDFYSQGVYQGGAFRTQLIERWLKANNIVETNLDTFVAHPRYDDFWKKLNFEAQAGKVRAPAVYTGGWYDIFLQGTINAFTEVQHHGGDGAKGKCRLVIGPVGHGTFNELKYPANAARGPACGDVFAWFDHVLLGKENAVAKEKAVHYYVMGDPTDPKAPGNVWRHADDWPPPAAATAFYFHPDGALVREKAPTGDGSKTYAYDPKDPVPNVGGQELGVPLGPMDQRKVETRPDVLLFTTEELKEPVEVTGRLTAKLFISSDCPDTDFTVKLCDVYPDGRSMLVTDGILRARYHKSFEKESFLEPGRVYELTVDLWSTSLVFNKGHRIRVAISSSNSPRFEANPNTGKPFRADNETRVAKNTVHLSAKYPSHIVLPVYQAGAER